MGRSAMAYKSLWFFRRVQSRRLYSQ